MDAAFKYLSKTSYLFSYVSVLRFLNLMKKYWYRSSHNTMSFMIHSYWNDIFFLDLLCKHVFKHYYWLGPYWLFHKLCIKNPKMLHLTSHKFYFQVARQGNVILRIPIFTTFCYAKNMMWVDFKCHKFNNSHFILVTKVTIHYHKKKKKIQYLLISIPTIAATLKFMGRRNTAFHFTPETSGTYTFYWYFLHSVSRNHWD